MARHFTVTLTSGTNNGPYTIYHTSSTNGNQALLYGTTNQATGLTLAQVQGGVLITVPDNATSVIFYNNNATMISDCPTNIVEYPLSPSGTPTPSPTPSSSPAPSPSPTPSPSATASPTPTPSPSTAPETTEISAILLCNTTSGPNNANCDEGNDGVLENRVFVLYNTTWFTTNASGKNVVKSTFSLTDNEIINGGDSSYTIHPDSIWTGGPSVFRNSSDGTYMISDNSTEGAEKLLFQKNGNFGTTNKCGGPVGG